MATGYKDRLSTYDTRQDVPWPRRWTWVIAIILMVQFVVMAGLSFHAFQRFESARAFGIFHQAWFEIAHGNLNPYVTATGYPFWQDHGAIIMWPLSLLYWVYPNDGFTLLLLQNLGVVAGEAFALAWIVALAGSRSIGRAMTATCVVAALCLFVLNPWWYRIAVQDFHFQTVAACFTIAAGYALWSGQRRAMWVWVALALATGDVAGTYVLGLGLSFAVTTPRCRRGALAMAGAGIGWVVLVAALGANKGSVVSSFAYLAGAPVHGGFRGLARVAVGAVSHPSRPLDMLHRHAQYIGDNLTPTGFLGLFNPWMFGPIVLVLLTNSLNSVPVWAGPGFQSAPIYLFGTAGTAMTTVLMVGWRGIRTPMVTALLVLAVLGALVFAADEADRPATYITDFVTAAAQPQLERARSLIPSGAEVVATNNVYGRLAGRRYAYDLDNARVNVPINAPTVAFVFVPATSGLSETVTTAMRRFVVERQHATAIVSGPYAWAYLWHPPPGVHEITLAG